MLNLAEIILIEAEVKAMLIYIVLEGPLVASVRVIIQILLVLKAKILPDHHLIQRLTEVALEQMPIKESLANDPAHKTEVVQMLGVDVTLVVRVVGDTVLSELKQAVVRVKHSPRQLDEEVTSEAACINTSLPYELYVESAFQV